MTFQGWYVDPLGVHDARWFSAGEPTDLVRDDAIEARDPWPAGRDAGEPTPFPESEAPVGTDLIRVDGESDGRPDPAAALDIAAGGGVGGPQD